MKGLAIALCAALTAIGCGGSDLRAVTPDHDVPVPASEQRVEMKLRVDLAPAQGCEEAFDLALYKDRGVDLVQWDKNTGACASRVITVRYLPRRTSADALLKAVQAHAAKVEKVRDK